MICQSTHFARFLLFKSIWEDSPILKLDLKINSKFWSFASLDCQSLAALHVVWPFRWSTTSLLLRSRGAHGQDEDVSSLQLRKSSTSCKNELSMILARKNLWFHGSWFDPDISTGPGRKAGHWSMSILILQEEMANFGGGREESQSMSYTHMKINCILRTNYTKHILQHMIYVYCTSC